MRFTKVQGLGNDFVLVNGFEQELDLDRFPELAVKICDRHFGVGADGLVPLLPSRTADVNMRIYNSDGSEAEMCGNVIRCAAKYLFEHDLVKKEKIRVETLAGIRIPELIIENGQVTLVRVDMGEPCLERSDIPMLGAPGQVVDEELEVDGITYRITAVSMGNPHCIIFVPDVEAVSPARLGPRFETHPAFPRKTFRSEYEGVGKRGRHNYGLRHRRLRDRCSQCFKRVYRPAGYGPFKYGRPFNRVGR